MIIRSKKKYMHEMIKWLKKKVFDITRKVSKKKEVVNTLDTEMGQIKVSEENDSYYNK